MKIATAGGGELIRVDQHRLADQERSVRLFACVRNEMLRLPYFLEFYRGLGVSRFFFIDNDSADGTPAFLASQPDVHLFTASGSYAASLHGVHWLNSLLGRFGAGSWVVVVDADELLVYPALESTPLPDLTRLLEASGCNALLTVLIDMYAAGPIRDVHYQPGTPFLAACPYFDSDSYSFGAHGTMAEIPIRGGARKRLFWRPDREYQGRPPFLPKIPLVKWEDGLAFRRSTHVLEGARLASITGALLHFKLFADFMERALLEAKRGEHWDGAAQYSVYAESLRTNPGLVAEYEGSVRLRSLRQLVDLGLMIDAPVDPGADRASRANTDDGVLLGTPQVAIGTMTRLGSGCYAGTDAQLPTRLHARGDHSGDGVSVHDDLTPAQSPRQHREEGRLAARRRRMESRRVGPQARALAASIRLAWRTLREDAGLASSSAGMAELSQQVRSSPMFCRSLALLLGISRRLRRSILAGAEPRALLRLSAHVRRDGLRHLLLLRFAAGLHLPSLVRWAGRELMVERLDPETAAALLAGFRTVLPEQEYLELGTIVAAKLPAHANYGSLVQEKALLEVAGGKVERAIEIVRGGGRGATTRELAWIDDACCLLLARATAGHDRCTDTSAPAPRRLAVAVPGDPIRGTRTPSGATNALVGHLAGRHAARGQGDAPPLLHATCPALWSRLPEDQASCVFLCGEVFPPTFSIGAFGELPAETLPIFVELTLGAIDPAVAHHGLLARCQPIGCGDLATLALLSALGIDAYLADADTMQRLADAVLSQLAAGPEAIRTAQLDVCRDPVERDRTFAREAAASARLSPPSHSAMLRSLPTQGAGLHSDGRIDVVLAFDADLLPHVPTMLTSLLTNSRSPVRLICCVRDVAAAGKDGLARQLRPCDIVFIDMDAVRYPGTYTSFVAENPSTMDRLLMPLLLPRLERIIYLDVDLLVLDDMTPLWTHPTGPLGLAACPLVHPSFGPIWNLVKTIAGRLTPVGGDEQFLRGAHHLWDLAAPGFNAGVLVMDLATLRANGFTDDTFGIADRYHLDDNESLILWANGRFAPLDERWNYLPTIEHQERPSVIHWAGPLKPWLAGRHVRHQELWLGYRRRQEAR